MSSSPSTMSAAPASSSLVGAGNTKGTQPKPDSQDISFADDLGNEIVLITIGVAPNQEIFPIHKTLLCSRSTFFDRMFNGGFREASTQSASLPEDNIDAFKVYVTWLYRNIIEVPKKAPIAPVLIRLFAFAEKYCLEELVDNTMDYLVGHLHDKNAIPWLDLMVSSYASTHTKSKLRILMSRINLYVALRYTDAKWEAFNTDTVIPFLIRCPDLTTDMFRLIKGSSGKKAVDPRSFSCEYHQHSSTKPCPYGGKSSVDSRG
ncbi:uncharacterized protein LY89DRAFT_718733 [Mollisia scopiformis]|uniref:BTB domain-containing protein n=1 Tax=Mollisia scopiformis TaxID=149040 RepID=A0A194XA47_MOLSC|nr:uncharacterized protein LY89DRAFT_718733 [Mollisia scopiformis]KUJ17041.1 hypothetical protein LY89DRAFT_718733 [Mollisia scopiformis]